MRQHTCPYCQQAMQIEPEVEAAICPQCYQTLEIPRRTHWAIMVVPLLVLYQMVWFT